LARPIGQTLTCPRPILFRASKEDEVSGLYVRGTAGGAPEQLLLQGPLTSFPDDWSADGRYVVYEFVEPKTRTDLWMLPLFGDRKPQPFLVTPANEAHAKLSPDGKWIAYASDALDRVEVFDQPFPSGPGRWQVSTSGGDEPLWRRDGKELFYLSADRKLMAVAIHGNAGRFEAAAPRELFSTPLAPPVLTGNFGHYAVSADGQRFLLAAPVEEAPTPITVVVNWRAGLKP
jgi:Tol biopolymer transport system component